MTRAHLAAPASSASPLNEEAKASRIFPSDSQIIISKSKMLLENV